MEATEDAQAGAKSAKLVKTASTLIAGGLTASFTSADAAFEAGDARLGHQLPVFAKGRGARLWDVDGREYIDYIGADGSMILGHADDRVVAAISKAAPKGSAFGAPAELEVRLAELIVGRFSAIDMVRLTATPAEARQGAAALARVHTGRPHVITFDGYRGLATTAENTLLTEAGRAPAYNDTDGVADLFHRSGSTVAAVVVEPVGVSDGLMLPADRFLKTLRTLCDAHGALLVFDETVTGLRISADSVGSVFGVAPDLTILGPLIGGGLPLGAFGGTKTLMRRAGGDLACNTATGVPGTRSLIAMAAGVATLQAIGEPGFYEALSTAAGRLHEGFASAAARAGVATQQTCVGSLVGLSFPQEHSEDAARARPGEGPAFTEFFTAMLERGVLLPPSPRSCIFVSTAHTDEDVNRTIEAAQEAFSLMGMASTSSTG
jgi:glutamate-1-semialdehyde 2,1-aminomutase